MKNRIDTTFESLRAAGRHAFMPFLAAGDPDLSTSAAILRECVRRGADIVELGVPYSDPVADGSDIQAAFTRALDAGTTLDGVFGMVSDLRRDVDVPIVSMLSFSIVYRVGPAEYMRRAAEAGVDGAIIPDLPVEAADEVLAAAADRALHVVFLVAPSTTEARLKRIIERASGFIYCVSVAGVTGALDVLPKELTDRVRRLKADTGIPVAVGFGVSTPEHVRIVTSVADGAIVGSALVKVIHAAARAGQDPAKAAGDYVAEMAAAARGQ